MPKSLSFVVAPVVGMLLACLSGCSQEIAEESVSQDQAAVRASERGRALLAVDDQNTLLHITSNQPQPARRVAITGLAEGETVVGIDVRPADQMVYATTTASRVYRLDPQSGAATAAGPSFTPALVGESFGFDFNPVPDRIRVHSDAEQDLRLNPNTGALAAVDGSLAYAAGDVNAGKNPSIVGTAYTNSVRPAPTSTTLYAIDSELDVLVRLPSPNNGQLVTIGSLGVDTASHAGFDIAGDTGVAYAALSGDNDKSWLYTIDLTTGAATRVGHIAHSRPVVGLTVLP